MDTELDKNLFRHLYCCYKLIINYVDSSKALLQLAIGCQLSFSFFTVQKIVITTRSFLTGTGKAMELMRVVMRVTELYQVSRSNSYNEIIRLVLSPPS